MSIDLAASPIEADGAIEGAVLTLRDRTAGDELQALVQQRERSEEFARLASSIAHEIRNPLGGIRGAAELLEKRLNDEKLVRYPELIRAETDRIRGLLDDLAVLTHGGDLCAREVNLHRVLDDLLELASRDDQWAGIEIQREYDPSLPELWLDPDRITQVFLNLTRNAVQAMEGSGQLVLRTRVESGQVRTARSGERKRWMRVDVEDTGPGIAEQDLPHVFTPFYTARAGGSGLGLAIAQHWVVRHGGSIELTQGAGRTPGTRARVLLPFGKPA